MLLKSALLALPLLTSTIAIPTAKLAGLTLQSATDLLGLTTSESGLAEVDRSGFSIDLEELRLVQFGEDSAPVWISELEKIQAKAKGIRFMDMCVFESMFEFHHFVARYSLDSL